MFTWSYNAIITRVYVYIDFSSEHFIFKETL